MPLSCPSDLDDGSFQGIRVLVVEDNGPVAGALASVLTDTGMAVTGPAATSHEAEQLTMTQSPDLALVDLNLGDELAVGLIEWLLQRNLRVIVMSGLAILPMSVSKNAAFLQKPFSADELFAAMRQEMLTAA
jgi:DNA-binding response OmpR family regulator